MSWKRYSNVVFVGNMPYNTTEEQLVKIFKLVGQVIGFRLVFDRDTDQPKGYGFCELVDHDTAILAVQNLNNHLVCGRRLRVDLADPDPFLAGKTTRRGEIIEGSHFGSHEPRTRESASGGSRTSDPDPYIANVRKGIRVPEGSSAIDIISQTLAGMEHRQLIEVLAQIKGFVIDHPDQSCILFQKHPQLSYALVQALLLTKIIDPSMLPALLGSSCEPEPRSSTAPVATSVPVGECSLPSSTPRQLHDLTIVHYPPQMPPFPLQGPEIRRKMAVLPATPPQVFPLPLYKPMPSSDPARNLQPATLTRPIETSAELISEAQRAMLLQVLNFTQGQVDSLGETEHSLVMQLRNQISNTYLHQ